MRTRLVGRGHYLCADYTKNGTQQSKPPKQLRSHLRMWGVSSCSDAVVISEDKKIVAVFRLDKDLNKQRKRCYWAAGTWVDKAFRGLGLATKMWTFAIKKLKPKTFMVHTASPGGRALIESLKNKFKNVDFRYY